MPAIWQIYSKPPNEASFHRLKFLEARHLTVMFKKISRLIAGLMFAASLASVRADLAADFKNPPPAARPWVYWFWNNANVTKAGITADLEAMKRAGIGGVIIMDVVEKFAPPRGTAEFMNAEWRELFQFAVTEARRLGLEINLTNGPGWCGSSGPWITPELSMQMLVWTNLPVAGPANLSIVLPQPDTGGKKRHDGLDSSVKYDDYYRDVAVLAFPEPVNGVIPRAAVVDLTARMGADGRLDWQAPAGNWLIERIGHTTTGSSTRPPVVGGNGLECDKLSREAIEVHFTNMIGRLVAGVGKGGPAFVATHIDSWEVGSQNWTPKLREEFLKRRGYDPLPWLPCLTGSVRETVKGKAVTHFLHDVDDAATANRFRWDFAQTVAELLAENYSGHFAELAHTNGLRYTLEGYDLPFGDEATYTARADEPMSEFWMNTPWAKEKTDRKGVQMASVAHTTGKIIVGAEAFTSDDHEKWMQHPATIKALGDFEFCQGINRFVIHRYAHQPYLDRAPGATMGPWGLHYERTQTWWEMSTAWHEYLARCQYLLRQGKYVAELCYLRPENPNQTYFTPVPPPPAGYHYDEISAEALIERMSVQDGRIVLPDGMNYRVLILPDRTTMTPALARKLKQLVADGATVFGPRPKTSPGLQDFPKCDEEVAAIGNEVWGDCDGQHITAHTFGKGSVNWGDSLKDDVLADRQPPFVSDVPLNWIHRSATNAEIYFIANGSTNTVTAHCDFNEGEREAEIWNPETGEISAPAKMEGSRAGTLLTLELAPGDSTFVVFREKSTAPKPAVVDEAHPLRKIIGPWQLSFPPKWGAPEKITMPRLISWTDSADNGVKYFSGTAAYQTTFDLPKSKVPKPASKIYLELGEVQVMARVKVNGKDCGIAWRPPFRVEVTDAVRAGKNNLEIEVANLWPNRLIGDAALSETNRFTWSSWQPFKSDSPLLKSGLLGPVRLLVAKPVREVMPSKPARPGRGQEHDSHQ